MFYGGSEVMTVDNVIILIIYYSVEGCGDFGALVWTGGESRVGVPFSLQLVKESIKEEIDMTANAVTHQTPACVCAHLCVCVYAWGGGGQTGGRNGELNNKQDL